MNRLVNPFSAIKVESARVSGTNVRALVGERTARGEIKPMLLSSQVETLLAQLEVSQGLRHWNSVDDLKREYAAACRLYYTVAAVSRRRVLDEEVRSALLGQLYQLRSRIEHVVVQGIEHIPDREGVLRLAVQRSFFGVSAKQGVSVRYALHSCVPTTSCGGRCYAHDGRDRELHLLFRAALNYWIGMSYEQAERSLREMLIGRLAKAIDFAVHVAREDATKAALGGFTRRPRVRFSHIGEMASTPEFANRLAKELKQREPLIECVIYTRHPGAQKLDPEIFNVNFTLEGAHDTRIRFAPPTARIVNSAWDGQLSPIAEVNFLEHHVEKNAQMRGEGHVCPVTVNHKELRSCDEAKCDLCFRRPSRRAM